MAHPTRPRHLDADVDGLTMHYREAGIPSDTAVLLIHGSPASSHSFRNVLAALGREHYVVAPDLIGYGFSDAPKPDEFEYTFERLAEHVEKLLRRIGVRTYVVYVTDFGTAVGYYLATRNPSHVLGVVVQNGSVHNAGTAEAWDKAREYWANPTVKNRDALGDWLNFEGTRDDYLGGLPDRILSLHSKDSWHLDWERLSRPGNIEIHEKLFLDYGRHVARFSEIAEYHRTHQPPCLLLWGRHDTAFDVKEILAYLDVLDRVEAHIFDGGHFLTETHAPEVAAAITSFVREIHDDRKTRA